MFRLANTRDSELFDVSAEVAIARRRSGNERVFESLSLERPSVTFFPLSWTVVHPIDGASPMYGLTSRDLTDADAEFLVRLTADGKKQAAKSFGAHKTTMDSAADALSTAERATLIRLLKKLGTSAEVGQRQGNRS